MKRPDLLAGTIARITPPMDGRAARRARRRARIETAILIGLALGSFWLLFGGGS